MEFSITHLRNINPCILESLCPLEGVGPRFLSLMRDRGPGSVKLGRAREERSVMARHT